MKKFLYAFNIIFFCVFINTNTFADDCIDDQECMLKKAIETAQENRIKDSSSELFSCMLSNWHGEFVSDKSELSKNILVYNVFGYERFLACYRSDSGHGTAGEIGVDTERRKVINGTRFRAEVTCNEGVCSANWLDTDCCYDLDLVKYVINNK